MERLGVRYVPDPAVRPGTLVLDKVQYPAETAAAKAGDCDDLAVLYAALLAGAGIRAAVISYPDHVLVMFDTGLFDKNRLALTADAKRAVVHQGRLWVPVETTMAGKGFLAAWKSAAADFHRAVEDGQRVSIIDLEAAWKEYPPAPVSLPPVAVGDLDLGKVLEADARALKEDGTEGIRACMAELAAAGLNGADALNRYGILAAALGRYDTALACFERAQASGGGAAVRNNRACALILAGDEKQALDELNKIYKEEKNGAAAVNRALCLYLGAVDAAGVEKFVAALKEASAIAGSTGRLARLLGIDLAPEEGVRAAGDRQEEKPQTVDRRRLKELIRKRVLEGPKAGGPAASVKSGVLPFGGVRGADPQQVAKVADLLFWIEEL